MTDWAAVVDERSGKTYYYNKITKATQWTKPEGFDDQPAAAAPTPVAEEDPESVGANWVEATDPKSKRSYYYNKKTKKTVWKRPACMDEASTASETPAAATPVATPVAQPQATQIQTSSQPQQFDDDDDDSDDGDKRSDSDAHEESDDEEEIISKPTAAAAATPVSQPAATPAKSVWGEAKDPNSGRSYWFNRVTKETTWKRPAELEDEASSSANTSTAASVGNTSSATSPAAAAVASAMASSESENAGVKDFRQIMGSESDADPHATKGDDDGDNGQDSAVLRLQREDGSDSEDEVGSAGFRFSKHRKGTLARLFRTKNSIMDQDKILSWKKSLIKKALLKQNRELDEECIQAFKNVVSYMGDRNSSKAPIEHAKKMLRNLMIAPSGLRDEVYVQICKQTNKNPRLESTVKGWELMRYCLATFPPSKSIKTFLSNYIVKNSAPESGTDISVQRLAAACITQLEKIAQGQRKQIPSKKELEALKALSPVTIEVPLLNGEVKVLNVDSYTTVSDVEEMITSRIHLVFTEPFALYEVGSANVERLLDPKERILDVIASWENEPPDIEDNSVGSKHAREYHSIYSQLLYKAKLVLKLNVPEISTDAEAINLLYIQAVSDVVTDRYPVKEKDSVVLAALQLQATHGDYKPNVHIPGWLSDTIVQYIPTSFVTNDNAKIDKKIVQEWEDRIMGKYRKFNGFTQLESRSNYLQLVQEWTFYGATFFTVEQRQFKDYPSPLSLGITCEGLLLLHPQKRTVLEYYPYPDIVTWGHSDEKFIVVVGNIVQQRKLIFKSGDGKVINTLVHDYVKFKVRSKSTQAVIEG